MIFNFGEVGINLPTLDDVELMNSNFLMLPIHAKFSNHNGWSWYIIAGDVKADGDVYCYGYVTSPLAKELGMFLLSDILDNGEALFCPTFQPCRVADLI